jgi:anthranilate synthase component 2
LAGNIVRAKRPMHGKESLVRHTNIGVFRGTPNPLRAIRYHSLVIERATIPDCLEITAESEDDHEIMGVRHKHYPIEGVQFHPESILSEAGMQILSNFLSLREGSNKPSGVV